MMLYANFHKLSGCRQVCGQKRPKDIVVKRCGKDHPLWLERLMVCLKGQMTLWEIYSVRPLYRMRSCGCRLWPLKFGDSQSEDRFFGNTEAPWSSSSNSSTIGMGNWYLIVKPYAWLSEVGWWRDNSFWIFEQRPNRKQLGSASLSRPFTKLLNFSISVW